MENYSKQILTKPSHIPDKELIAILGESKASKKLRMPHEMPYQKSELAINVRTGEVQVYVTAENNGGLQEFKKDYPDAVIREDATLDNPDDWRVLAFPMETMPDESTPLDNYYQVKGRELVRLLDEKNKKQT